VITLVTQPDPQFFIFDADAGNKYPEASVHDLERVKCPGCGRLVPDPSVPAELYCESGSGWPDVMQRRYERGVLLSERVAAALEGAGIHVRMRPARITRLESKKLTRRGAPKYVLPILESGIRVDREASGMSTGTFGPYCAVCGTRGAIDGGKIAPMNRSARRGIHAVPGSWTGLDLFISEDMVPVSHVYCTRKVLELARRERWTGARFEVMDAPSDLTIRSPWKGIPYLAKKWPPEAWCPPPPDAGKTPKEWVAQLARGVAKAPPARSGFMYPQEDAAAAVHAILWIGPPAVPYLVELLRHENQRARKDAAWLLSMTIERDDVEVDPEVKELMAAIAAEVPEGNRLTPEEYGDAVERALDEEDNSEQ
jgi:hypothetical protein